jgi:phage baseplate assembly protein V
MRPEYGSDNSNQTWLNLSRDGVIFDRRNGRLGPEVQVYYQDRDVVTDWMPVNQQGSAGTAFHFLPRVGDNATVLHLGSGVSQGIVIGTHATDNNPTYTPNTPDSISMASEDGAFFEHEPQSSTTTMAGIGTLHISVGGDTLAFSGGTWTLNVGGDCDITAGGNANVTAANATIKAGTITLDGDVTVTKSLTINGFTNAKGGGQTNPHMSNVDGLSTNAC